MSMMIRPHRPLLAGACLAAAALAAGPAPGVAQAPVAMRGEVWDSTSHAPLSEVGVVLSGYQVVTSTDEAGSFDLPVVPAGTHTLILSKPGYRTRVYSFEIGQDLAGQLDVGVLSLAPGEDPLIRMSGFVMSGAGAPVPRASVSINGREVAMTDSDGLFAIDVPNVGNNLLEVRRIGFVPHIADLEVHGDVEVAVTLQALPIQLDPILVEADRTFYGTGRIREFFKRRETGQGKYFTRWEIEEMNPMFLTDVFRRVPGVRLTPGAFGRNIVTFTRENCAPRVYVDGLRLEDFNIDDYLQPEHVQGIEVYSSGMMTPPEFSDLGGGTCGAIVIWTR